jgi:glutamate--cysteine ligase regulatory subunit
MVARHRIQADCTITNLILSIDELRFSEETELLSSEKLASLWTAVTGAAKDQPTKVLNYGIAEFSSEKLAALYKYAQESGDPVPNIDHINANDCCALPPGLISFSKEHGVKLLAHHDPEQILSPQDVASLSAKFQKIDLKSWSWVLRLTYIACERQVLTANEYLACVTV